MSITTAWAPFFQSHTRMRGRAYQLGGRVERIEPEADELVRARVRGREAYTVTIRQEQRAAIAECTCPAFAKGAYCKHIWATLLDVQQNSFGPGASAEELAKLRVRAPKARKRDQSRPQNQKREPDWVGRLSLMRITGYDSHQAEHALPDQRQVCYVVLSRLSTRHGGLVVDLRQRTPSANGWTAPKAMRLTPSVIASLSDPEDRELCALLLGATSVHEHDMDEPYRSTRGHATFKVQAGAWRTMLRRMIQTGRCYVESDDLDLAAGDTARPLIWDGDQPWALWMKGTVEGDELCVGVELRRGDQRMAIDRPVLVLGGWDGLVIYDNRAAAFDDRDAFRWAAQFREQTKRGRDEPSPLRVPLKDVPQFLDRLYLLPQLPEIDLPEGIARQEQKVRPTPCLDLSRPGEAGKNQVQARVWFDYAGQRVSPAQPGRFVPVKPVETGADTVGEGGLSEHDSHVIAEESVESEALMVSVEDQPSGRPIRRDLPAERRAMARLSSLGLRRANGAHDELTIPAKQVVGVVQALLGEGWVIHADRRIVRQASAPKLSVSSGIDWFELHGTVTYQRADGTEQDVPLPQILAMAKAGQNMITLDDGTQGLLPEQWLSEHGLLTGLGKLQGDHLRFKSSQAALLDALLREQENVQVDDPFNKVRERLHRFEGVKPLQAQEGFHGKLRPYQEQGLGWLAFLRWFGVGGVLADDMGLGKTIQVLAMLHNRKLAQQRAMAGEDPEQLDDVHADALPHRPSLVVAPRSVVFNWLDEAEHFAPNLRVLAYSGTEREALRADFDDHDLIVTSYGLMRRDIADLKEHKFDYIVLDEAQAIKNPASQSAKAARLLEARHRLALTGTPIENHLGDLWSIFEFLNPGMLGSNKRFTDLIRAGNAAAGRNRTPNSGQENTDSGDTTMPDPLTQIARAIRPFVLRRTKTQVLKDLPEKTEQTIVCQMEPAQRKVYDDLRAYYHDQLLKQMDSPGDRDKPVASIGGQPALMVLEALLRLRQAACHPGLIDPKRAKEPSAKLESLLDKLVDVIEEGSKALVFSQFTSMLALVKPRLEERGIRYCYLDGQTRNRRDEVRRFQEDADIPVFLISLKAGGFGLNLTAAEYVFILDPWWNPAVEAQAIDRTHRIGQTKPVFAYRMVCQDTVEQRIIELQDRKRRLAEAIVGGDDSLLRSLSREDLEKLLS